jgi:hypothetical protein
MDYTEWLDSGKPYDTLFYAERRETMVDGQNEYSIKAAASNLCSELRLIDVHILSKHQAWPIAPDEIIDSDFKLDQPAFVDHRRMFFIKDYGDSVDLVTIIGRQYYDTHED